MCDNALLTEKVFDFEPMSEESFYDNSLETIVKKEVARDEPMEQKIYTTLESCSKLVLETNTKAQKTLGFISGEINLLSWMQLHPEKWSTTEVLDWLFYVADQIHADGDLAGEKFQIFTGEKLCKMSLQDFVSMDQRYGATLFHNFRKLLSGANYKAPVFHEDNSLPDSLSESATVPAMQAINIDLLGENLANIDGNLYDFDMSDFNLITCDVNMSTGTNTQAGKPPMSPNCSDDGYHSSKEMESSAALFGQNMMEIPKPTTMAPLPSFMNSYSVCDSPTPSMPITIKTEPGVDVIVPKKRGVGRPRKISSTSSDEDDPFTGARRGRKPGQCSKGNHLWEFIRDLLKDPSCSKIIKWEDQELGVFRFMQSEKVAKKWGQRKNNPAMTYEKLSRAMRHYYSRGILEKTEGSRRLVYKFGPNANLNPII